MEEIQKLTSLTPKKFGGWLILLGYGLHTNFIGSIKELKDNIVILEKLSGAKYLIYGFQTFLLLILLFFSFYTIVIFWQKKKKFIKTYYYLLAYSLFMAIPTPLLFVLFLPQEMSDKALSAYQVGIFKILAIFLIWGTYIKKSIRVKETFTRE